MRGELVDQLDDQLEAGAETLRQIDDLDTPAQLALLRSVAEQPDRVSALLVYGVDDQLLMSVPSGRDTEVDGLPDVGRVGVAGLRARDGVAFQIDAVDGSTTYRAVSVDLGETVLVLATPTDDVRATMGRLLITMILAAVIGVGVIALATSIVIRRAIRPVDEMIQAATAIGHGDLTHRIETSSNDPDVHRLSDALNDMLHQLEDAFAAKGASEDRLRQFVADASHELRTPLASIRGYSELYLSGAATDPESTEKAMTRIQSEALRTGGLVEDLLLLARLDQGRELVFDDVELDRLVTDCVADAKAIEPERSITLDLPDQPIQIRGDEARLRQVIVNLLANTRAHAPGAPVTVVVRAEDDRVELRVRDLGPGLDETQANHVFDRFWRADGTRNRRTGGSGLGLAISAAVVEAHHGSIAVDSSPGAGATFTVELPVEHIG